MLDTWMFRSDSGEISDKYWEHVMAKTQLNCSSILCKVEHISNGIVYLAEQISKHSINGVDLFLLTDQSKMQKERDESKKKLLSKKEPKLKDLENSQ